MINSQRWTKPASQNRHTVSQQGKSPLFVKASIGYRIVVLVVSVIAYNQFGQSRRVAPLWPHRTACLQTPGVGRDKSSVVAELDCPASTKTTRTTSPLPTKDQVNDRTDIRPTWQRTASLS